MFFVKNKKGKVSAQTAYSSAKSLKQAYKMVNFMVYNQT